MNNRLYVGNLSYGVTKEALHSLFAECGDVDDTHVVMDRETGRARGFGFVTMKTDAEANRAMAELNGAMFEGRPLKINVAEERGRSSGGGGPRNENRNSRGGHRGW
jgi:RNA recognition motif-containing protein